MTNKQNIEVRLDKLIKRDPVANANIIRKLRRQLRKL
jgi:hypothetical protein